MAISTFKVQRLLDLIRANDISKKEFCEAVNISPTTLSNMQNREDYEIGANKLAFIADYFCVSMDYFYDRDIKKLSQIQHVTSSGKKTNNESLILEQAHEIEHLKEMLEEKERTIQILLKQN